jgi:Chitin binding Peritrophin-A domain
MSTFIAAYLKFSCPVPDREVEEGEFLYYKHEKYMTLYYMCLNGKPRLLDCGPRAIWDENEERCVDDAKYRRIQYYKLLEAQKLNV